MRMKTPSMNNPQPSSAFLMPTQRLSDTSPTIDFMTKFSGFFCPKCKALGFPQFPWCGSSDIYAALNLKWK